MTSRYTRSPSTSEPIRFTAVRLKKSWNQRQADRVGNVDRGITTETRRAHWLYHGTLLRRFDPQYRTRVLVGEQVQEPVRPLPDIADALMEIRNERFPPLF